GPAPPAPRGADGADNGVATNFQRRPNGMSGAPDASRSPSMPARKSGPGRLAQMLREMLVHLEHRHAILAEDLPQLVIGNDLALVLRVLQIVLLDMVPDLADHLAARQRRRAGDLAELFRGRDRPLQSALPTFCHSFLPLVNCTRVERKSRVLAMVEPVESALRRAENALFCG